jgi:hypothetical protein
MGYLTKIPGPSSLSMTHSCHLLDSVEQNMSTLSFGLQYVPPFHSVPAYSPLVLNIPDLPAYFKYGLPLFIYLFIHVTGA